MRFLASVTDEHEARLCVALGADIIDAKDPSSGALGPLSPPTVAAIRAAVPAHLPVSATIGDPGVDPEDLAHRAECMAAAGVDYIKVGLDAEPLRVLGRLQRASLGSARLVAVLLADRGPDLSIIGAAASAGFAGVMLDTADKRAGALPDIVAAEELQAFLGAAKRATLFAGLAGSLHARHARALMAFGPDVLGFRGGLCRRNERAGAIDADAVRAVRRAINNDMAAPCCELLQDGIAAHQAEGAL